MLLPSSGSLDGDVIAQVGVGGLALARTKCGECFSLVDLRQAIARTPDTIEKTILETIARIVEGAHRQATGKLKVES